MTVLQVGDVAPDFDLPALIAGVKKRFRLGDQREKKQVVLAFYPSNWEPVSDRQMMEYQVEREKFFAANAEVVGICVDSIMNTTAWEREVGPFDFPLCSDFWPHGEVAQKYGVLRKEGLAAGASERAVFVVDKSGKIRFRKLCESSELPKIEDILGVLHKI